MAKIFEEIDDKLADWIRRQHIFFVGTAPVGAGGNVNVSPKGMGGTFEIRPSADLSAMVAESKKRRAVLK